MLWPLMLGLIREKKVWLEGGEISRSFKIFGKMFLTFWFLSDSDCTDPCGRKIPQLICHSRTS